nr:copia protein [Tanacetum cinerariifolium]
HMIGNKAHLADYQEFKGGSVTFRGRHRRITGKGKIKAGCLDFEDVYYVKELKHYNLFFVSQMYDKKNKDDLHRALKDKGIVDSGCSRHMTGNKAHIVDYQEFKGGSVAFGGSNGRITGKGKIKAGRLDFKDVYYVEELKHYNIFSVSQICDKKNKVLFTDTDYLVMSPDFKLPDENQVLLKIPKQHNMYSFNLKNIDPSGVLACLFAKASIDESNKWHRRLGHMNFKNLNKLVKGNLVRGLPSKIFENDHTCVACQKGKQHKASLENQAYKSVGPKEANNSAGTQANDDQDKIEKNTDFKTCEKPVSQVEQIFLEELEKLKRQEKEANDAAESPRKEATHDIKNAITSNTNLINTASTSLSTAAPSRAFNDDLPFGKKAIETKWVYRNKKDEMGVLVRNKARLVSQGHRQEEGIDYDEFFAPVARNEAIRIFLAFASYMGFIVYQMDVKSAFMYGTIDEEVYVSQPPGFVDPKFPNKVYKVVKALYGLHQAPTTWYATLSTFLEKSRYRRGAIDKTLFIKQDKKDIMLVQVYVDDIIFGSTKKSWRDKFEELMKNRFQMSSIGELTFFLGLQVKQKNDGIFISQDKYVAEILKKFNFLSVKAASTPIDTQKPLVKDKEAANVDVHLYRSIIGSLMYLTASRPDIMFAVCACSRF